MIKQLIDYYSPPNGPKQKKHIKIEVVLRQKKYLIPGNLNQTDVHIVKGFVNDMLIESCEATNKNLLCRVNDVEKKCRKFKPPYSAKINNEVRSLIEIGFS